MDIWSNDYFTARARFRESAARAGATLQPIVIEAKAPGGEELTIDVARCGAPQAERVLLHLSGIHGVEGFAGSAIQLEALYGLPSCPSHTSIIFVHVLNPYGMAWLRRVNEENVDLNRNALPEGQAFAGAPSMYASLDALLNPRTPPANDAFLLRVAGTVLRRGMPALKQAVAGGQYEFPRGLFFGGKYLQRGLALFRDFLRTALAPAKRIIAIDVHTGLGRYGRDSLFVDRAHAETMRQAFGDRVTALESGSGAGYSAKGGIESMILAANPAADASYTCQELGTFGPIRVVHALREENRWHHWGKGTLDHPAKQRLKQMFYPDDDRWRREVLKRGGELLRHALASL